MSFNRRAPPPRSIPAGFRFVAKKADLAAHAEIVLSGHEHAACSESAGLLKNPRPPWCAQQACHADVLCELANERCC